MFSLANVEAPLHNNWNQSTQIIVAGKISDQSCIEERPREGVGGVFGSIHTRFCDFDLVDSAFSCGFGLNLAVSSGYGGSCLSGISSRFIVL